MANKKTMKYILLFLLFISFFCHSQCTDCSKNFGGWTGDGISDLKKHSLGISILVSGGSFSYYPRIIKCDFNCKIISEKIIESNNLSIISHVYDDEGNLYLLASYGHQLITTSYGPHIDDGIAFYKGLNLLKFSSNNNLLWSIPIGSSDGSNLNHLFFFEGFIYITGTLYNSTNINPQLTFNFSNAYKPRAIILKLNGNGEISQSQYFGDGIDFFSDSIMDNNGNFYLTKTNFENSSIIKINSNFDIVWSKIISNRSGTNNYPFIPTKIHFNTYNQKLYIWGSFNNTTDVLGNIFTVNDGNNSIFQSLLAEFEITNGNFERIKRFDNNSSNNNPYLYNNSTIKSSAYIENFGNDLYIFTNFKKSMTFPNSTITSSSYFSQEEYFSQDLLLFKLNLNNFESEFLIKSQGASNTNYYVNNFAGPIMSLNNQLYITSSFSNNPINFNGSIINNNSGNNDTDVMLYKYNLNYNNSGQINIENTCENEITNFSINGLFDSITWDFGDPLSANNSASTNNAQHLFTSSGNYLVSATVTCGSDSQTIQKNVIVTNIPSINQINAIVECETISGTGICSTFDTSNINFNLIGLQQNLVIQFKNSNGYNLPSPLPNPYINSNPLGDLITAKIFYQNNPECYTETTILFKTIPKPIHPTLTSPQTFCIQQNPTLNSISISGQNIKWYDAQTLGNLLPNSTVLTSDSTYYASQTINSCESLRVPITINIQNTHAPTGNANQSFCATQNATLNEIVIIGNNINWYSSPSSTVTLPNTTLLVNGSTFYATQTINGCESVNRFAVTITLTTTLNATNYSKSFCDDLDDGLETILLTDYNSFVLSSTTNEVFTYYNSNLSAENQIQSDKINPNYTLTTGTHTVFVRIDSSNGCHQVIELNLTLFSNPVINLKDIIPICENKDITINAGIGFDSYTWSTGITNQQSILITQPGSYSLTVTKNNGPITCSSTKNFTVVKSNIASISSIETSDWTDNQNTISVFLSPSSVGNYEYSLDGIKYQDSPIFDNLLSGFYTVYVNDKNNCGEITDEVFILMYPTFFTPNNDGFNDYWKIKLSELEPGLNIKIFDRYGKFIKLLDNDGIGWDGTYVQKPLPADDYWFVITRANGKEYRNHFTLKR